MNNDTAKIVLQADLSKSAAAIAKQLPKLSDEIAQRGKLKIQAVIDPASIQEQAMSAMRPISLTLRGAGYGQARFIRSTKRLDAKKFSRSRAVSSKAQPAAGKP